VTDSAILKYGLGVDKPGAPELANHTILVVVDAEQFAHEPRCLTDYGLHTFTRHDMLSSIAHPGAHGESLLQKMQCYHVRLLVNVDYVNRTFTNLDLEKSRFDNKTFATTQEAKDFLTKCISWSIDTINPGSGPCPVIFSAM
jgi:hypothetical protein